MYVMKKCFILFICFVFMLLLAALTDNSYKVSLDDTIVESEIATKNELSNEIVFDTVLKE